MAVISLTAVVFILCVFGHVHALLEDPSLILDESIPADILDYVYSDPDVVQAYRQQFKDPSTLKELATMRVTDHKCSCIGTTCQCCVEAKLKIFFHLKVCAGFTYDPAGKSLDFTITVSNHVVFRKKISVTTPVKFCHAVDIHHYRINLCVGLSDISFQKGHAGACIYMEIDAEIFHWKQKLGCLYKSMKTKEIVADHADDGQDLDYRAIGFQ